MDRRGAAGDPAVEEDRLRAMAAGIARRIGGLPAVRTLRATLETFDQAGGGLVAGGLAYASLVALLPGLLLALSVLGLVVDDAGRRASLVAAVAVTLPPLEGVARAAFDQVSAGAVPGGILAVAGLVWGSSRFYAALDEAIARVFHAARRRGEVERAIRGLVLTALFVVLPVLVLVGGSVASWLLDLAPETAAVHGLARTAWQVASPVGSLVVFVTLTVVAYRFVPAQRVPWGRLLPPAVVAGAALAVLTQVFTFVAPRLVGAAALYGAFVTVFALLAWLAIGFNILLLGASWTRVRSTGRDGPAPGARQVEALHGPARPGEG